MKSSQILAVGGKFFTEVWERPLLQQHLLSLSGKEKPIICYLGTAVGDNPFYTELFYRDMGRHNCNLAHINMFSPFTSNFEEYFSQFDIIYVSGGATRNLVTIWRDWGVDTALEAALKAGVILAGTSAGAICWFEGCITDSLPSKLMPLDGLGLLGGSACTHYDARPDRRPAFQAFIRDGLIPGPGIAIDDHAAAHFIDGRVAEVVCARAGATAYRVERHEQSVRESPLTARLLT